MIKRVVVSGLLVGSAIFVGCRTPVRAEVIIPACDTPQRCVLAKVISEGLHQPPLGQLMIAREAITRGPLNTDNRTYTGIAVAERLESERLQEQLSIEAFRNRPNLHHWKSYFDLDHYEESLTPVVAAELERIVEFAFSEEHHIRISHFDCANCPRAYWFDKEAACPFEPFVIGSQRYCALDQIPGISIMRNDHIADEESLAIEWSPDDPIPQVKERQVDEQREFWGRELRRPW